jgi:uncharacterized membrane protein
MIEDEPAHESGIEIGPDGSMTPPPRLRDFTKLPLLIIAAMFVTGVFLYQALPARFPTHWGIYGTPDAYSAKSFGSVFALPIVAFLIYALLVLIPRFDPKRRNLMKSISAYNVIIDLSVGLMALVFTTSMIAAFRPGFDVVRLTLLAVGVMFAVIGNYMRTVKQNWTFGVRISWTLSDEVVWARTNRLAGYLFVGAGVVTAASAFIAAPWDFVVMMSTMAAVLVVTYAYAFLLFRSRHPEA